MSKRRLDKVTHSRKSGSGSNKIDGSGSVSESDFNTKWKRKLKWFVFDSSENGAILGPVWV